MSLCNFETERISVRLQRRLFLGAFSSIPVYVRIRNAMRRVVHSVEFIDCVKLKFPKHRSLFLDVPHDLTCVVVYQTGGVGVLGRDFYQFAYYNGVVLGSLRWGGPKYSPSTRFDKNRPFQNGFGWSLDPPLLSLGAPVLLGGVRFSCISRAPSNYHRIQ